MNTPKPKSILDAMAQANFKAVINLTHQLIRQIETMSPHIIIAASAIFFLAVCQRFNIRPINALEIAQNMLNNEERRSPKMVGGLRDFLSKEI
jgi:hypothetical protein